MAFQTDVLRGGEWFTETVAVGFGGKSDKKCTTPQPRLDQPPNYGILTRTVIESPVAHWMLPVRLRSAQHMDVAIIGDHYVQISEMGRDGRLRNIIRKTNFGSRIRNAQVIGASPENAAEEDEVGLETNVKTEEDATLMECDDFQSGVGDSDGSNDITNGKAPSQSRRHLATSRRLPPQQLLIVLESGDCIFLFIEEQADSKFEFVSTHYRPFGRRIVQPGFHLAVDPSSRYMAMACPENFFVVHELESPQKMNDAYARHDLLNIIRSSRPRAVQGVIHKMEFLYPHSDDDYHIILLLIVVRNGKSRMVTYEWEAGDSLASVLREEKRGQPLPAQHQMPILIIPLTLHSAFFAISAHHIGVCKNALNLPLEFDDFTMEVHERSRFHHGRGEPLWSAWTRPYRLPTYNTTRDSIYLAREDGVVMFLDINSDNILGASVEIGKFECNIGTAFCSVFDEFNDILIMSGDSGPGTIWQIRPRQPNIQLGKIPNWSPVIDLVTSDEFATVKGLQGALNRDIADKSQYPDGAFNGQFSAPDRVFGTSGRGVTGAITEFRYGMRADVGLEVDFPTPVKQSWIFATRTETFDVEYHASRQSKVKYWTRYKKSFPNPVFSAVSLGENVFSCVGNTIYWDRLDLQEKRLAICGTYELSSCATSLRIVNKKIVAVTNENSIEIIDFSNGGAGGMALHHADADLRSSTHMIEICSKISDNDLDTSVLLVCDRDATASGLWVPWRQPGKDCSVLFEADLPTSVRKLVRGRTRPSWQSHRKARFGLVPSTPDGAEILGVCLDGSLQHFTLLSLPAWRLLRLVHDLALTSPTLYPFVFEKKSEEDESNYEADPSSDDRTVMQIDGDMLQRCVNERALEELFTNPAQAARLYASLKKLDGDYGLNWEPPANLDDVQDGETFNKRTRRSIDLLYTILDYYLQPVL
ncbi:hypothetical protein SEPCBS119000_005460 [Sporothrix epigloea]|uniref:RSE1/DDB1/CPSF1 first beta-propeller domain-containing protein n=1 Tax=Sporothrix epigloea TaxID=1892477 RepID=A0ABP0E1M3_9PEZI